MRIAIVVFQLACAKVTAEAIARTMNSTTNPPPVAVERDYDPTPLIDRTSSMQAPLPPRRAPTATNRARPVNPYPNPANLDIEPMALIDRPTQYLSSPPMSQVSRQQYPPRNSHLYTTYSTPIPNQNPLPTATQASTSFQYFPEPRPMMASGLPATSREDARNQLFASLRDQESAERIAQASPQYQYQ